MTTLRFESTPSILKAYGTLVRPSLLKKKKNLTIQTMPKIDAVLTNARIDPTHLMAFHHICSIPLHPDACIHPLYPHLLAAALHAQLITHQDFPYAPAGLIHVRNSITVHAPMTPNMELEVRVAFGDLTPVKRGLEFELLTHISCGTHVLWEERTTVLVPQHMKRTSHTKKNSYGQNDSTQTYDSKNVENVCPKTTRSVILDVPVQQGRKFACVSGDFNPIHLHTMSAKLFGFKRAIAHGVWTLGRTLGEIHDDLMEPPYIIENRFLRPVYLPSSILLQQWRGAQGLEFKIINPTSHIPHMKGRVIAL